MFALLDYFVKCCIFFHFRVFQIVFIVSFFNLFVHFIVFLAYKPIMLSLILLNNPLDN